VRIRKSDAINWIGKHGKNCGRSATANTGEGPIPAQRWEGTRVWGWGGGGGNPGYKSTKNESRSTGVEEPQSRGGSKTEESEKTRNGKA